MNKTTERTQTNQFPSVANSGCISNPGVPVDRILSAYRGGGAHTPTHTRSHCSKHSHQHQVTKDLIGKILGDERTTDYKDMLRLTCSSVWNPCLVVVVLLLTCQNKLSVLVYPPQEKDMAPEATDWARCRHISDI